MHESRNRAFLLVALTCLLLPATRPAFAEVRRVPSEYPTIQDAVDAAVPGDTVLIDSGTYRGPGNRDIDLLGKRLSVIGEGGAEATVVDCENVARGFLVRSGEPAGTRIVGIAVMYGSPGSGIYGGGVLVENASVALEDCVFDHNGGTVGGAIWADNSQVVVETCRFRLNVAGDGGAIAALRSSVSTHESVFIANIAYGNGGAGRFISSSVVVEGCTFVYNQATDAGSVFAIYSSPPLEMRRCIVYGNLYSRPFDCTGLGSFHVACSDIYGNSGSDWGDCLTGQGGIGGNFEADPLLCNAPFEDLRLHENSPCLPGHHPYGADCGLIGALGVGCGNPTATASRSWGAVKGLFGGER